MQSRKLTVEFLGGEKLLSQAEELFVATAFVSEAALSLILRNINGGTQIKILTGIHLPSKVSALEKLIEIQDEGKVECRLYTEAFFHPKLYLISTGTSFHSFIGSGNFSLGGLQKNVELFHKEEGEETYEHYKAWFLDQYQSAKPLTTGRLDLLRPFFQKQDQEASAREKDTQILADLINEKFNLDSIDFSNQFFNREHHETFSPQNRHKEFDEEVENMRTEVRKRLFDLDKLLWPEIARHRWDLHHHYIYDDTVSKVEPSFQRNNEIAATWLHYGRSKPQIKAYGQDETPLYYARLQVIIHYNDVGIWLRFGKAGGSRQDREYFQAQMKDDEAYRVRFFDLVQNLDDGYWIEIAGNPVAITEFENPDDLWKFTRDDDWRSHYFIIGTSYEPGSEQLSNARIVNTVLSDFMKLYPLYEHMRDKSFG